MCACLPLPAPPARFSRRSRRAGLVRLVGFILAWLAATGLWAQQGRRPLAVEAAPPRQAEGILIDGIHAHDLTTVSLGPRIYDYHETCGSRRSFDYLRAQGVRCTRVTEGPLTSELLSHYRLLFINLISAERPPFLVPEILAIRDFVAGGGSLLVIVDHSNCYYHAHHLMPLFAELQTAVFTDTACDVPPNTLDHGNAWLSISRFRPHPVTEGLQRLGMQTGGRVDPRYAVALTSSKGWADRWSTDAFGHENSPGFYGNFQRDADEPAGPMGVVLARNFGRGRMVVISDQNMIGDTFLHYADNYRLWLNSVAWLLEDPKLKDAEAYCRWRQPRIVLYEPAGHPEFACNECDGLYFAFVLASRYWWTFASNRWPEPCDLLVVGYNNYVLPPEDLAAMVRHLRSGRNLLILNSESALLWDELGVVSQVLTALGIEKPAEKKQEGKLILELPGCGSIQLLGPDTVLDNGRLASAIKAPTKSQRQYGQMLLDAIHASLSPEVQAAEPTPRLEP